MTQKNNDNRIINPTESNGDLALDQTLRPKTLAEYIGQENIKENLRIFMQAAKGRS